MQNSKTCKKSLGALMGQNSLQNKIFFIFSSLVFLDVGEDCCLGQCLSSSTVEPKPPKAIMAQIGADMVFLF